jgi:hypothetical protein
MQYKIHYAILKYIEYKGNLLFHGREEELLAFCERARKLIDFWYSLDCTGTLMPAYKYPRAPLLRCLPEISIVFRNESVETPQLINPRVQSIYALNYYFQD